METPTGEAVLVAAVSDGAGSAERSQVGSQLACALVLDEMKALLEAGGTVTDITPEFCKQWLTRFQNEVSQRAEAEGLTCRAFACTLLVAVIGAEAAVFFQIGDGAIVVQSAATPGDYDWMFWPEKGEYENQTYFATESGAIEHLQHSVVPHPVNEVALFSDGLQRLALHMETQAAYAPFFRPMFAPLYRSSSGYSEGLSAALAQFLSSKRVQEQTDDDTTLILATRLPNPSSVAG